MFVAALTELNLNLAECLDEIPTEKEAFQTAIDKLSGCASTDELNSLYQWLTARFEELFAKGEYYASTTIDIILEIIEDYAL